MHNLSYIAQFVGEEGCMRRNIKKGLIEFVNNASLSHCAAILKVASSIPVIGGSSQHTITKRNDPSPNHDVA